MSEMTTIATREAALNRYNYVSRELAGKYVERGDMVAAGIQNKIDGYQQALSEGANVTNARHAADTAASYYDKEVAKLSGEIEAGLVELRYLDQLLAWLNTE